MPTFADNFQIGDVIYGISQARGSYLNSLGDDLRTYCRETGAFLLCDEYNNRSFLDTNGVFGTSGSPAVDSTKPPISMTNIQYNLDFYEHGRGIVALSDEQKDAARRFYDAMALSGRSPQQALQTPTGKLRRNNENHISKMIRRACKFGLEHMIMVRGQTVHFVLDVPFTPPGTSMNMTDVVNKVRMNGAVVDDTGVVPITFSELRCCYRYRHQWMPTGRLKFYLNLNEVAAPWVSNPALWQQYGDARARKAYKAAHPILAAFGFGP